MEVDIDVAAVSAMLESCVGATAPIRKVVIQLQHYCITWCMQFSNQSMVTTVVVPQPENLSFRKPLAICTSKSLGIIGNTAAMPIISSQIYCM